MPTVPVLDGPRIATQAMPTPYESGARANPDVYGAGLGQSLQQAGGRLQAVAQKVIQDESEAQVMEAYGALAEWDAKRVPEYLSKRGKDAIGTDPKKPLPDQYLAEFDTTARDLSARMSPQAKQAWDKLVMREREQLRNKLTTHELRERETVREDAYKSAITGAVSRAANYPTDGQAENSAIMIDGAIAMRAEQLGWTPARIDMERREHMTRLHLGVLDRLADSDPARARTYLDKFGGEIDGEARGRSNIDKRLAARSVEQEALGIAREIQGAAPGDLRAQLSATSRIADAEVYKRVRVHIEDDHADTQKLRAEEEKQRLGRVFQMIEQRDQGWRSSKDFINLSDDGKADAFARYRTIQIAERGVAAAEAANLRRWDEEARADFNAKPARDQVNTNVDTAYPKATKKGRDIIRGDQKKAKEAVDKGFEADHQGVQDLVNGAAAKVRLDPTATKQVARSVLDWWTRQTGQKGAPPTISEVEEQVAAALLKYRRKGAYGYITADQYGFQLKPDEMSGYEPLPAEDQPYSGNRPRPSLEERLKQLKREGKSKDEAKRILKLERYEVQ